MHDTIKLNALKWNNKIQGIYNVPSTIPSVQELLYMWENNKMWQNSQDENQSLKTD